MAAHAIFVSYRRNDAKWFVGRFGERLKSAFEPDHQVFLDVDSIPAGRRFADVIGEALDASLVVLVVIGPRWLTVTDEAGRRRLDDPEDWVRVEVETALGKGRRVIPVLVDDTPLPGAQALPESLRPLVEQQLLRVTFERFGADMDGLVQQVHGALADEATPPQPRPASSLDPEPVSKAEALVHWEFVKDSGDEAELRHHLERFPAAVTARMARRRLEALVWARVRSTRDAQELRRFLEEFPEGAYVAAATRRLATLDRPPTVTAARVRAVAMGLAAPMAAACVLAVLASVLPATPSAPPCGNGLQDPGEHCDFGAEDNDGSLGGCTEDCQLVWIDVPAGTYTIGNTDGDLGFDNEGPAREVTVPRSYRMLATEVTEAQRRRFGPPNADEDRPWVDVDWNEALAWCTSVGGALPSEVEWEIAARGGTATPWSCGDSESCLDDVAWYSPNAGEELHAVGGKAPNAFGLHDLHGNVWEWVGDCWDPEAWGRVIEATDSVTETTCLRRVFRGGSYQSVPRYVRAAYRGRFAPTDSSEDLGFRCVSGSRRQPGTP